MQQAYIPAPTAEPRLENGVFLAADNAIFPYRVWLPKSKPKAVIVALHGMNDYSNAFAATGEYMRAHGIAVYAYDQRGFGAASMPGVWGNNQNLVQDARQFSAAVGRQYPRTPLYLLGESMGGAVAIVAAEQEEFAGLILSAPAVWRINPLYRGVLWTMAHSVPSKKMTGSELKILASDNIPMLIALGKDPLVIKATRTDAIYGLVGMMDEAYADIPNINVPVLLLYGGKDQVIPKNSIEIALARFSHPITFAHYPQGYHMLLRDLENERALGDIAGWVLHPNQPVVSGFGKRIEPEQDSLDH